MPGGSITILFATTQNWSLEGCQTVHNKEDLLEALRSNRYDIFVMDCFNARFLMEGLRAYASLYKESPAESIVLVNDPELIYTHRLTAEGHIIANHTPLSTLDEVKEVIRELRTHTDLEAEA